MSFLHIFSISGSADAALLTLGTEAMHLADITYTSTAREDCRSWTERLSVFHFSQDYIFVRD